MYYYIHLNGAEYLRTRDALLASNIFSSLVQQANPADVQPESVSLAISVPSRTTTRSTLSP